MQIWRAYPEMGRARTCSLQRGSLSCCTFTGIHKWLNFFWQTPHGHAGRVICGAGDRCASISQASLLPQDILEQYQYLLEHNCCCLTLQFPGTTFHTILATALRLLATTFAAPASSTYYSMCKDSVHAQKTISRQQGRGHSYGSRMRQHG